MKRVNLKDLINTLECTQNLQEVSVNTFKDIVYYLKQLKKKESELKKKDKMLAFKDEIIDNLSNKNYLLEHRLNDEINKNRKLRHGKSAGTGILSDPM